jgi:hypothetical protein
VIAAVVVLAACAGPAADSADAGTGGSSGPETAAPEAGEDGAVSGGGLAPAKGVFDPLGIHEVAVEISEGDWKQLLANAADPKLERPWLEADVTIDGVLYAGVGVRNFGDGSQQENPKKPNIRVKFNAFDPALRGPEKLRNIRLKAGGGESTFLREPLFYDMLRAVSLPAPLFSFARVRVRGQAYGLYQLFEHPDERMWKRLFGNTDGRDYDPEDGCIGLNCPSKGCATIATHYTAEHETPVGQQPDFGPLISLVETIATAPDAELEARLAKLIALDSVIGVYALEAVASDYDGLAAAGTNFEIYQDSASGLMHVIRGGADGTFAHIYDLDKPWGEPNHWCGDRSDHLYKRLLVVPALRQRLDKAMRALHCGPIAKEWVYPWLERYKAPLLAELAQDPKILWPAEDITGAIGEIATYLVARRHSLDQRFGACPQP